MSTIDYSVVRIQKLATHNVRNKEEEAGLTLSENLSACEPETEKHLATYFLQPFKNLEFFKFDHPEDITMNEVYLIVQNLFADQSDFLEDSQNIAKLLFEASDHPKIKSGKLSVCHFTNIALHALNYEAIGIFKSETDTAFLKIVDDEDSYYFNHEKGFDLKGVDKACLILNTNEDDGYKILIHDANKSGDAHFWKEEFLKITPFVDEYHHTKNVMNVTKNFVTQHLDNDLPVSKTEKIDLLNRSMDYFKSNENFERKTFEEEVLQEDEMINSYRNYEETFFADNNLTQSDTFEINDQAVKKQSRIFKSVLKLDKNFHVYIHGKKELIEQGMEDDGRKFYKIYYEIEN